MLTNPSELASPCNPNNTFAPSPYDRISLPLTSETNVLVKFKDASKTEQK